ncbi:DUF3261 domain-containing protein [Erwinia piriflorinigrans]|uniref:Lipoprotein n=1 Tax=Erwinia piriflorinigrans CFBP 5888 TaxID=1161919 RepID=V5Z7G9_9GAMM|nr:DUF3261 domain-containing protein [Erwinia piriflorinigrans]CCG86909.1 hypothetical protein EPIR_1544 [Erwinia piriflorinigrans CFBP 5888]
MKRLLALMCCAWLLTGCADRADPARPQAWLKPGVRVILPPPQIAPPFSQQQLLTGRFKGKQQSLLVLLSADGQQLTLAGLSSLGIRLFRVTYDANGIHSEQSLVLPEMPPPGQVLADIMLSHWPLAAWQSRLPPGWTLQDRDDSRQLRDADGKLVTEIRYQQRGTQRLPISVQQFAFGYHILIQNLDG